MIKTVFPFAGPSTQIARLVDVHSRGIDSDWMHKRAAVLTDEIKSIRPEKGRSFIHLITMGAGEFTGANRNFDYFNEKSARWHFPEPKPGGHKSITLDGGLTQYHKTFKKYAHAFKDHNNKDPELASGTIHAEAYNPEMHRGEVIVNVDNNKWAPELEKLARGEDIPVSMSCREPYDICFPAGTPIRTRNGWVAIEQVCVGDFVVTHTGQSQRVNQCMLTKGTRQAVTIKVGGYPDALTATDNHPFFALCLAGATANQRKYRRKSFNGLGETVGVIGYGSPDFVAANSLTPDDYCLFPAPSGTAIPTVDPWLAGLYLADGTIFGQRRGRKKNKGAWRPTGIKWSLGVDKLELVDYLRARISALLGEDKLRVYSDHKQGNSVVAIVHSIPLAQAIFQLFGATVHKHVPTSVLEWEPDALLSLLGGWLDGDGSQSAKKGSVRGHSVLDGIARGMWEASIRAGVPAAWHRDPITHAWAASEYINVLHFQAAYTPQLAEHSIKIDSMAHRTRTESFYITCDERRYLAMPIKSINETNVTNTYNLSVAVDESYIAMFAAVHNCSICGNQASSRKEYCRHLRDEMGSVKESGHQVFAINDRPTFFDISSVFRPADRIAYSLKKVASEGAQPEEFIPSAQLAEMWGISAPMSVLMDTSPRPVQEKLAAMERLAAMEKQIEATGRAINPEIDAAAECPAIKDDQLDTMRGCDLNELMGTLSQAKISLPIKDFFRLILGNKYDSVAGDVSAAEDMLPGIFNRMLSSGDGVEDVTGMKTYDPVAGLLPKQVRDIVGGLIPDMSLGNDPVGRRVQISIIRGGKPAEAIKASHVKAASINKAAVYLAKQYVAYQLAFSRSLEGDVDGGIADRLMIRRNYNC